MVVPVAGAETARKVLDRTLPSNKLMGNWPSSEGKPLWCAVRGRDQHRTPRRADRQSGANPWSAARGSARWTCWPSATLCRYEYLIRLRKFRWRSWPPSKSPFRKAAIASASDLERQRATTLGSSVMGEMYLVSWIRQPSGSCWTTANWQHMVRPFPRSPATPRRFRAEGAGDQAWRKHRQAA